MSIARSRLNLILLAGLAASLPLTGCDKDDAEVALRQAHARMQGMAPGRQASPSPERNTAAYNEVITAAAKVKGSDAQNASATLLSARAKAGLAEPAARQAVTLEEDNQRDYQTLRALLTNYISAAAQAQAVAAYNPAEEQAKIQKESSERDTELAAAQQRKAQADQQIASLRTQSQGKTDEARKLRSQSAELKGKMGAVTAVEAEALIKQARELGRQADALEVQAADLDAQAASQTPLSQHLQIDIDRINTQKQILSNAAQSVSKRDTDARTLSKQYLEAAAKVASDIRTVVNQIDARRTGDQAKALEDAIGRYVSATSEASKSARTLGGSASVSLGSLHQSLGDLYWAKAQNAQSYATELESLAETKPALPESGGYKAAADKARADAKEALDQATESYKAANDAYQAAGGGAEVAARVATLNDLLARNVKATSGGSVDIKAASEPAPAEGGGEAAPAPAPAAAADDTSPLGAMQSIKAASDAGDMQKVLTYFYFSDDATRDAMTSLMTTIEPAGKRLERAVKDKFGEDAAKGLKEGGGNMMAADFGGEDLSGLQFDVQGDTATATGKDGKPISLKQADGHWKLDIGASLGDQGKAMLPMLSGMAGNIAKAMDDLAAEIEAGKYPDAASAMTALQQKMMQSMAPGGAKP